MINLLALLLLIAGALFFIAGTIGLLRFPDLFCRLHALTKVDNLGLGLTVLGLMLLADSWLVVAKLLLIWLLALLGSAAAGYLMASRALALGLQPWRRHPPGKGGRP
ncbi:MAG: monovalent cation/H(+) antiporter subunit G [Gammaproteobacteria bacterium]|nr:monovalent cation/H(+) antiporter subunit G [Gammaproteobacteria bacterium]